MKRSSLALLALVVLILQAFTAQSATFTVTKIADTDGSCNSGVDCSLREAIKAANDETNNPGADTIVFAAGVTGTISLNTALPNITSDITIQGPGASDLEVTRTGGASFSIFTIYHDISTTVYPTATISGLSITNGHSMDSGDTDGLGGGILNYFCTLTVNDCIISRNTAAASVAPSGAQGGGICSFGGALVVNNSTFTNNTSTGSGGGIGGVFDRTVMVRNSTFDSNSALLGGGFAENGNNGNVTISNCTVSNNSSTMQGGGVANEDATITIRNSTFSANSSSAGGGFFNHGSNGRTANANLTSCTFSNNAASTGGGIYNLGDTSGNAFVTVANTILFSTNATPGANLFNAGSGTSITSQGYNLSSDDGGGFLIATGDQINTDPKLGPLQNNGGSAATMALLANSPAQDKGKDFGITTDQRGFTRPIDFSTIPNATGGDGTDIGAFEVDMPQTGPTFVVTTLNDHDDTVCSVGDCTLREAINLANTATGANSIAFVSGLTGTINLVSSLPAITDSVTITGPGARLLSVAGHDLYRVFSLSAGTNAISGLTISDGYVAATAGSGNSVEGAGLTNTGSSSLTLSDSTLSFNQAVGADNTTTASGAGGSANGGAIANSADLAINRCTFFSNFASGGRGANSNGAIGSSITGGVGGVASGAIYNHAGAALAVNDSTFAYNSAIGGAGANGQFGGAGGNATGAILNLGVMTLTAVTSNGNAATGGAGGTGGSRFNGGSAGVAAGSLSNGTGGNSTVRDTISAGNTGTGGPDANGSFTSGGYNLIGAADSSTGFGAAGDQMGTSAAPLDAMLGPFQNNGGGTNTFAVLTGSPAIDAGKAFGLLVDQRGMARTVDDSGVANAPGGDGSDIGAFETALPLLGNISTRLRVETGDNVLIAGFIITGTQPKKVILRGLGPSLPFVDRLANPSLELHQGNMLLDSNDDWMNSPNEQAIVDSTIPPTNALESAMVDTLPANNTAYTAILQGTSGGTGIAVVEAYDLDNSADSRLANISTRGLVQTGDNVMIGGFIILGIAPQKVLVRAIGPSLPVAGALADPNLELHDGNGALIDSNDNWIDSANKQAIIDTTIPPSNDLESALVETLAPGNYTAIVSGVNNGTGIGLVEIYALN